MRHVIFLVIATVLCLPIFTFAQEAEQCNGVDVSDKIKKVIEQAVVWVEEAESFAKEQAPLVVQEIINWGLFANGFWAAVWILSFLFCLLIALIFYRIAKKWRLRAGSTENEHTRKGYYEEKESLNLVCFLISLIVSAFFFIIAAGRVHGFLYIYIAPRLYIIDELKNMAGI
jgi:hypothetical protein